MEAELGRSARPLGLVRVGHDVERRRRDGISCAGADWAAAIRDGATVRVGLVVAGDGTPPATPALTID